MSDPQAIIHQVVDVCPHPESDKLDIVTIDGKINVANRPAPGVARYKVGDYAVVLGENLILPDYLIKHMDMWNHEKNKGGLAGSKGNRTKARRIGNVLSEVALLAIGWERQSDGPVPYQGYTTQHGAYWLIGGDDHHLSVHAWSIVKVVKDGETPDISPVGTNVAHGLGITSYQPPE